VSLESEGRVSGWRTAPSNCPVKTTSARRAGGLRAEIEYGGSGFEPTRACALAVFNAYPELFERWIRLYMWMKTRVGPRKKGRLGILIALMALALLGIGLTGIGPLSPVYSQSIPVAANGGVTEIDLEPAPEGPPLSFKRVPAGVGGVRPLGPVERLIPDPLPAPRFQWLCSRGNNMVVTLGDGKTVTYGPCYRPDSIDRLWSELSPPGPPP
jgi:hypothetical protein